MPFPGAVRATAGKRLLAAAVDGALAAVLGGGFAVLGAVRAIASARAGEPVTTLPLVVAGLLVVLVFAVFECWLEGEHGVTAGKRIVGLTTVSATRGRPIGFGAMARRYGLLLVDPRGWREPIAGAVVLDVRHGPDPVLVLTPPVEVDEWPSLWVSRSGRAVDLVPTQTSRPPVGNPAADEATREVPVPPAPGAAPSDLELPTQPGPHGRAPEQTGPAVSGPAAPGPVVPGTIVPSPTVPNPTVPGSAVPAPSAGPTPAVELCLWDGRRVLLRGLALVGRAPAPRPGDPPPEHLLTVRDPSRSVSKTHLELGVDHAGVWVRDRTSVNGTVVVLSDGVRVPCPPERRVRIPAGAAIAFGEFDIRIGGPS